MAEHCSRSPSRLQAGQGGRGRQPGAGVGGQTAASNGTSRRRRAEAANTATASSTRWTASTGSSRRRRVSAGLVTSTRPWLASGARAQPPDRGWPRPDLRHLVRVARHASRGGGRHEPADHRPAGHPGRQFVLGPERARITILTTAEETDGRHDLIDSIVPAGSATPLHLHTRYEERVYVISGALTVWVGPDKLTVGAGGYYHIPLNVPHMVQGGAEDTHAILISSPAGFAELVARAPRPTWPPRRPSPTRGCHGGDHRARRRRPRPAGGRASR